MITANGVKIRIDKQFVVTAYADYVTFIMAENEANLKNIIRHLLENRKIIGSLQTRIRQSKWS